MKFLKIGNTILNISQIECVTENLVTVGYVDNDGIEACIKDFVNTWGYRHD